MDADFYSELVVLNHSYEEIMDWEEEIVDSYMQSGLSLNMIPGGFKGLRELHKLGLLSKKRPSLKERDNAVLTLERASPRAGIPNPLLAELWKDDNYAQTIICGAQGRLSVDQIRRARDLHAMGLPIEKIAEIVVARNVDQIKRMLDGKTYSRIH